MMNADLSLDSAFGVSPCRAPLESQGPSHPRTRAQAAGHGQDSHVFGDVDIAELPVRGVRGAGNVPDPKVPVPDSSSEPQGEIRYTREGYPPDACFLGPIDVDHPDLLAGAHLLDQASRIPEEGSGPGEDRFGLGTGPDRPIENDLGSSRRREEEGCESQGRESGESEQEIVVSAFLVRENTLR